MKTIKFLIKFSIISFILNLIVLLRLNGVYILSTISDLILVSYSYINIVLFLILSVVLIKNRTSNSMIIVVILFELFSLIYLDILFPLSVIIISLIIKFENSKV